MSTPAGHAVSVFACVKVTSISVAFTSTVNGKSTVRGVYVCDPALTRIVILVESFEAVLVECDAIARIRDGEGGEKVNRLRGGRVEPSAHSRGRVGHHDCGHCGGGVRDCGE